MARGIAGMLAVALVAGTGCAVTFAKRSPWDIQQLAELSDQLEQFKTLAQLKSQEADELRRAKELLEQRLSSSEAEVGYDERGLVARMLDQVLFDSGKADLRQTAYPVLDKVAKILEEVPDQPIRIEGHTDNQPIRYSKWTDNHALSRARAQAVAEYLIEKGVDPSRMTSVGLGESHPIVSNDSAHGRQKNRRVEIVIMPQSSRAAAEHAPGVKRYSK